MNQKHKLIALPGRFNTSDSEDIYEELGIPSDKEEKTYIVADIWINPEKIEVVSIHSDPTISWIRMSNGLDLSIHVSLPDLLNLLKEYFEISPPSLKAGEDESKEDDLWDNIKDLDA